MWRMTVIMFISIVLGGCVVFPQQEPEEFGHVDKSIKIGKSTKADVIEILGEPQWRDPRDGSLYYSGKVVGQGICGVVPLPSPMAIPLPIPFCGQAPPEDWWIKITLDENEVVTSVDTKMEEEAEAALDKMRKEKLELLATQGDREAAFMIAREFQELGYLRALAEQGDREAAFTLTKYFDDPRYLKVLAEGGDVEAAIELAKLGGGFTPLLVLAKKGNSTAALNLYHLGFERRTNSEALKWLCAAASAGNGEAQSELGWWHRTNIWSGLSSKRETELRVVGVEPNDQTAYMWYSLAIKSGYEYAAETRTYVVQDMVREEIAQAEQMARDWKPGDCPSAEHRLGSPGET